MHKLVISDDEGKTTVVPLVRDELTIGRREGNAVRLTERNVSRRHARVRREGEGFVVEDLDSYNGVFLNDERVQGEARLRPGDRLRIGDYRFALDADGISPVAIEADLGDFEVGAPALPARLVMLTPPAAGAAYTVGDGMRLGRSEEMEIWVNHRSISREHVRFTAREGRLFVEDLSSANGITVDGAPCGSAELTSGNVLGLGQVRFRFVAEGEEFLFEPERAHEIKEGRRRAPLGLILGLGGLCVAIALGAVLLRGGPEEPVVSLAVTDSSAEAEPEGPSAAELAEAQASASDCEELLASGQLDLALSAADRALAQIPSHEGASACRADVSGKKRDLAFFAQGARLLAEGHVEEAFASFERLPRESELRESAEFDAARRGYVKRRLTEAQRAARKDPERAYEVAADLLSVDGLTEGELAEARRIAQKAQQRRRGAPSSSAE